MECVVAVNLVNQTLVETAVSSSVALEKLHQLSQPAALETLSRYFHATRDHDVASAQVGYIF